ncbi:leucine-rich repeat domain-containing protein [Photobacterium kagoshimensis]|uniref:leucine-rich repeat domain-containing protein n=1 Tax=Photobacterium kagoshimensis TaxID=2910242 RepID=UPI003D0DEB7E
MLYRILALIKISMLFLSFGVLAYDPLVEETLQSPQIKHVMDFLKENGYQSKPEIFIETYNAELVDRDDFNDSDEIFKFSSSSVKYNGGDFWFYDYQKSENYILVDYELNVTHLQLKLKTVNTEMLFSLLPKLTYLAIDVDDVDDVVLNLKSNKNLKELYLKSGIVDDVILPVDSSLEMIGTSRGEFKHISNFKKQNKLSLLKINNGVSNLSDINGHQSLELLILISGDGGKYNVDLFGFPNLKYLYVYGDRENNLSKLHRLTNLEVLFTGGGAYLGDVKLPETLRVLRFGGTINNKMPDFSNSNNLKKIIISYASFSEIKGLDGLDGLEELTIYNTPLEKISGLDGLSGLKKLKIERSNIKKVENVSHLSALEYLVLVSNKINAVGELDGLSSIKEIELQRNNLNHVDLSKFNAVKGCKVFLGSNPFFDNSEGEMRRKLISLAKYGA